MCTRFMQNTLKGCESLAYALSAMLGEGNICLDLEEYELKITNYELRSIEPVIRSF